LSAVPKVFPNNPGLLAGESERKMKFPMKLKYRGRTLATIYGRNAAGYYRLYWRVRADGKPRSRMRDFASYSEAKAEGDRLVRDLAKGSQVTALTPGQAGDAVAALQALRGFYEKTGTRKSLLAVASEYCEAAGKLAGRPLGEAVDGYLTTVASIKRMDLGQAVAEFIAGRKHLAESKDGKRPKHSPRYERFVAYWLNEFAATFPGHAVCDLTKQHLNAYVGRFKDLAPKTRNDRRAAVKMFLRWAAAQDYLAQTHRLFEAVDFKPEAGDPAVIDYYRPAELQAMLGAAGPDLLPVVALSGLAGIRIEECLRLDWADVWRVQGKIEIASRIAKGRQRRLVTMCPALAAWLEPFRQSSGRVCDKTPMAYKNAFAKLRAGLGIPPRRNGLRHAYITFRMALDSNENLTAAEAGNSPQMIHDHYRALETAAEAQKWFAVAPQQPGNVIQFGAATAANVNAKP